ncbi:type VII secretion system-associated protein [Nocardia sp. NPDC051463]|uniref:type VII secretion system-associated protein n=1 Tax=Nocardia sp. NPDC051463 TaxID=3154845 RepID=UPI003450F68B
MDQSVPAVIRQGEWLVLVAPEWESSTPTEHPPSEVIVGGWMMNENGSAGPFQPNPDYVPAGEATPTDPLDAILRLIAEGEPRLADEFVSIMLDSVVEIGCDEDNQPAVTTASDGIPCALIATAQWQKRGIAVDSWWPVVGSALPDIVPAGTDILVNPNGYAPFRLTVNALRHTTSES